MSLLGEWSFAAKARGKRPSGRTLVVDRPTPPDEPSSVGRGVPFVFAPPPRDGFAFGTGALATAPYRRGRRTDLSGHASMCAKRREAGRNGPPPLSKQMLWRDYQLVEPPDGQP